MNVVHLTWAMTAARFIVCVALSVRGETLHRVIS